MRIKSVIRRAVRLPIDLIESPVKKTNWYRNCIPDINNYPNNEWYRSHLDRNYDVVNVGSSSAVYAFDYCDSEVKAFNWAMQPQSMEYSYKVLRTYFSILKQKGIVLIPFSPFSGLSVTGKWTERAYEKYYYILKKNDVDNSEVIWKSRQHPFLVYPKESIKRLIKDVPSKNCEIRDCQSKCEFEKDAQRWIDIWEAEFGISDLDAPLTVENKAGMSNRLKTVSEMIDFCLERDMRPALVIPPAHTSLNKHFTDTFKQNYIYSFIEKANQKNVPFFDCLEDAHFTEDKYFRNSYFMSEIGAKAFTKYILELLG